MREPSQTVIAARNQRITRKSLQSSEYERTKLIGTVIITPPAKEIKEEHKDNVIKTEKEWLNLPKNVPMENISLNDPNVHPRLIHKDGSICHSKTYWKSLNKKPPLKEFELPDLFSDDEGPGTENNNKGELITNTTVSTRKTRTTSCEPEEASVADKSTYNKKTPNKNIKTGLPSTQGNDFANGVPLRVNTEKTKAADGTEPLSVQTDPSKETHTGTSNIARTDMVTSNETNTLTGTNTTDVNTETDDDEIPQGNDTAVTETNVNTEKIDDNETPKENDTRTQEANVNTETTNGKQQISDTPKPTNLNEDWASLMFHSDDSLFDEMTKQIEDRTDKVEPIACKPASTATQEAETLPDIVLTQSKTDAATGLLMLSLNPAEVDAEIDNERDMPINPPSHKEDKPRKIKGNSHTEDTRADETPMLPRKPSLHSKNNNNTTPPKSTLPKGGTDAPNNSGSPRGVLTVTRYNLRKGTPNKYVHRPLKCTMCNHEVNSKSELKTHHQDVHKIIYCEKCNKGFATKESLRKHSYTHTTGNNYKCLLCKISFTFPSELDAHMIKHDSIPNYSCNIVGCKCSYFRKAELTAHIKTHDGKLWKCTHKECNFEAVDKRYLTAHKKKHSDTLNYFCRCCKEGFKYFEQRKRHKKTLQGK